MMEKFHHILPDGYELVLPRFENIEVGVVRRIRKLGQIDQIFTLLEHYLDEEALEHFDKLQREDLEGFANAWRAGSSNTLGESSASSAS